jgi:hypothetical protein
MTLLIITPKVLLWINKIDLKNKKILLPAQAHMK